MTLELVEDLATATAELPAHLGRDAGDIGVALLDLLEERPDRPRQLVAQDGLVDKAGGAGLPVDRSSVERRPSTVRPFCDIGDKHVGVERRVTKPARPMPETGGDEAVTVGRLVAGVPAPDLARVTFQVGDGCVDGALVAAHHGFSRRFVAESPHEGHRLRRREREVEAGERGRRRAKGLPGRRVVASENRAEVVGADVTSEADRGCARTEPAARCLPSVEVVVLGAVKDLLEVIRLLPDAELADAQHDLPPTPRTPVQVCDLVHLVLTDALDGALSLVTRISSMPQTPSSSVPTPSSRSTAARGTRRLRRPSRTAGSPVSPPVASHALTISYAAEREIRRILATSSTRRNAGRSSGRTSSLRCARIAAGHTTGVRGWDVPI